MVVCSLIAPASSRTRMSVGNLLSLSLSLSHHSQNRMEVEEVGGRYISTPLLRSGRDQRHFGW